MDGRLNKKAILMVMKYTPWLIGASYFIQIVLGCFGIESFSLSILFGVSVIPALLLCLFSYFLGYCIWNRLPLYYVIFADALNAIDFYIGIPVTGKWMLIIYLLLIGIFILIGCLIKDKEHAKERDSKKNST